jgi:hypothetical protein
VSWLALGGAALVQLIAGVVRARAWFHIVRQTREAWSKLRYRDVALAQLGGCGWNAVLPAKAGEAVKVALVNRRLPERRLSTLAATLVPPAVVEAIFTGLLLVGLLGVGVVSAKVLTSTLPAGTTALIVGGAVCAAVVAAIVFRRRVAQLIENVRAGLATLGRPRVLATQVVPWLLAGRVLRLLAFALVLTAAGVPFGFGPALALMALQGATPSAGAAATAARIALLAAVLSKTGAAHASAKEVAAVLAEAYVFTTVVNLAASASVIAWELRTLSPSRIFGYARSAMRTARERTSNKRTGSAPSTESDRRRSSSLVPDASPGCSDTSETAIASTSVRTGAASITASLAGRIPSPGGGSWS